MMKTDTTADHPAKWSASVLVVMADAAAAEADRVGHTLSVLDPFAGVGRARLAEALGPHAERVDGIELQPEWSGWRPGYPEGVVDFLDGVPVPGTGDLLTLQGTATDLPPHYGDRFDAVFSSPCYGNRCADSHDAKDKCKACNGSRHAPVSPESTANPPCPTCKGTGLSWRNTYAHALRRAGGDLVPGSAAAMHWGREYRLLHRAALAEMVRVVVPGGLLAINMSNHIRDGVEQDVVGWWVNQIIVADCILRAVLPIETPRNRNGENRDVRVDAERLILAHTPKHRRLP
jgi:SAM-dependent methyltransferase